MRKYGRTDSNQTEVVKALRGIGATVHSLAPLGNGCPDVLVGYGGTNWILEIKDGDKPPSARKLTDDEKDWHAEWRGTVHVVETVEQALQTIRGCV